jgi:hypothetical protein
MHWPGAKQVEHGRAKGRAKGKDSYHRGLVPNILAGPPCRRQVQGDIAAHLDRSFQQVQTYEKGTNRIPVVCLVSLADYPLVC